MEDREWALIEGAWVEPFQFNDEEHNTLFELLNGYFPTSESTDSFINGLERAIEVNSVSIDTRSEMNDRAFNIAQLKKVSNGLSKAITALQSLDPYAQAEFSQHAYLAEKDIKGSVPLSHWKSDPTLELEILLDSANNHLEEISKQKHARKETPRYLVGRIVGLWRNYVANGRVITDVTLAWRDHERGKQSPEISLWLLVKLVLESAGLLLQDPSNYINEAIAWHNQLDIQASKEQTG
ncbi:hypothetical protein EXU30_04035 [Shewanella maritima]|uniref:Uncharacterized protein n=1 Tax=Shewanella maritima TaxID=2520507 RepID=A0A411PEZ1_9GAMM|nr:hypothetical protein [Shewanella maritima]QBF81960.1 hypothetical protein EXU30_04035 [Shewanella maritima]